MPAPTNINVQIPLGAYPGTVGALALDLLMTAADVTNGNSFQITGREILIVWNSDVSGHHFTLSSVADKKGRSGDVSAYAIAAGVISAFNFNGTEGWSQGTGVCNISADNALVKFAILRY
ncbi:MAG TPA: hypothetical protein VKW06_00600 [Candidatus Angelobacter sp.]|nr:hypothetical protein [Candidatus Angelobacter sp.]